MKGIYLLLLSILALPAFSQDPDPVDQVAVELSRLLSRDLFELNGVDIMQPSAEVLNATANSRFYYTARVPLDDEVHFRFGLHFMSGMVPEDLRTFNPTLPEEDFNVTELLQYGSIDFNTSNFVVNDTVGLSYYILKTLIRDGIYQGTIDVPESAATLLGKDSSALVIPEGELSRLALARFDSLNQQTGGNLALPAEIEDQIVQTLNQIPSNFTLLEGGNITNVLAGVPQFDIMYKGWELNLRYIPKLNYGEEFGDFGFMGVGIKNMLSQYFYDEDAEDNFRLALQLAYQNTSLENTVGVTQATLKSGANIFNINLHGSQMIKNWFEIFAGVSYEVISINTSYEYLLPVELQYQLGLLDPAMNGEPSEGFPGDQSPQLYEVTIDDTNVKLNLGINRSIGPIDIFAAYSLSQFNIFSFGVAANF